MTKKEFEELAGYRVFAEDFEKVIEPMYMATDLDKRDFVKTINKDAFAAPTDKDVYAEGRKIVEAAKRHDRFKANEKEIIKLCKTIDRYIRGYFGENQNWQLYSTFSDFGCTYEYPTTLHVLNPDYTTRCELRFGGDFYGGNSYGRDTVRR